MPRRKEDRLALLRRQQQLAFTPQEAADSSSLGPWGKEAIQIHQTLLGDDASIMPVNLKRIIRALESFARVDGYEVALLYVSWQVEVAERWLETNKGVKPHSDVIKGWSNNMEMRAKKNWNLRVQPVNRTTVLTFDESDTRRYA